MARAFDWQSKGQEFDSPNLHLKIKELQVSNLVTLSFLPKFCQQMEEKRGQGVEISGWNEGKFEFVFVE